VARPTQLIHHDATRFGSVLSTDPIPTDGKPAASVQQFPLDWKQMEEYCRGLRSLKWQSLASEGGRRWRKAVNEEAKLCAFPWEIRFPEDKLRERFLADHPLERMQPQSLDEQQQAEQQRKSFNSAEPVLTNVDDVVRYQMHLMSTQHLSEDEAYGRACKAFYATRSRQVSDNASQMQKIAQIAAQFDAVNFSELHQQPMGDSCASGNGDASVGEDKGKSQATNVVPEKPATKQWMAMEEEAIRRGMQRKLEQMQVQRERQIARQTTAAV
jgi:hypothetical protein